MNIEELKLVLETVQAVSGDVQIVAVVYILFTTLLPVLAWLIVAFMVYRIFMILIPHMGGHDGKVFLMQMRDDLGIGRPGELTDTESAATQDMLRRLVQKHLANKAVRNAKDN